MQLVKTVVNDSRANLNTQQIVEKTKSVVHNAAETAKGLTAAAKERIVGSSNPEVNDLQKEKKEVQDTRMHRIVDKTKAVMHNVAEATKDLTTEAKDKLSGRRPYYNNAFHPTGTTKCELKPEEMDHRLTEKELKSNQCAVGSGPQVGVGDKMHDRAGQHWKTNYPKTPPQ